MSAKYGECFLSVSSGSLGLILTGLIFSEDFSEKNEDTIDDQGLTEDQEKTQDDGITHSQKAEEPIKGGCDQGDRCIHKSKDKGIKEDLS